METSVSGGPVAVEVEGCSDDLSADSSRILGAFCLTLRLFEAGA